MQNMELDSISILAPFFSFILSLLFSPHSSVATSLWKEQHLADPWGQPAQSFPEATKISPVYTRVEHEVRTLAADCGTSLSLKTSSLSAKTWLTWSWPSLTAALQIRNEGWWAASRDSHKWAPHTGCPVLQDTLLAAIPRSQCSISSKAGTRQQQSNACVILMQHSILAIQNATPNSKDILQLRAGWQEAESLHLPLSLSGQAEITHLDLISSS